MQNRVAVQTLGCKLNQAESESLTEKLADLGYQSVSLDQSPSLVIINTCTVTGIAESKCRSVLRRARALNPRAKIFAVGCYARTSPSPSELLSLGIQFYGGDANSFLTSITYVAERGPHDRTKTRTRSFVKVQEGCSWRCTYCIVPSTRGPERSIACTEVLDTLSGKIANGVREVVLTGTNVGAYLSQGLQLSDLIREILRETRIERLRISSLRPSDLTDDLLASMQDPRVCAHVHMALQSGSETVLRRMGRNYTLREYARACDRIRESIRDVAITTDIIVGFPDETQLEHEDSLKVCREISFANIHVFPYSRRPGTPANMRAQVAAQTRKERAGQFLALAETSRLAFHEKFVGKVLNVLWESRVDGSSLSWSGLSGNYLRVQTQSQASIGNRILQVRIDSCSDSHLTGELIGNPESL